MLICVLLCLVIVIVLLSVILVCCELLRGIKIFEYFCIIDVMFFLFVNFILLFISVGCVIIYIN